MTTAYKVLKVTGEWIKIRTSKPIRNNKMISELIGEPVREWKLGSFLDQFNFFIKKY